MYFFHLLEDAIFINIGQRFDVLLLAHVVHHLCIGSRGSTLTIQPDESDYNHGILEYARDSIYRILSA